MRDTVMRGRSAGFDRTWMLPAIGLLVAACLSTMVGPQFLLTGMIALVAGGYRPLFPAVQDALVAGYRACLRCKPLLSVGSHPVWVKDLLARVESREGARLRDVELVQDGIDPARARRYFQEHFGMTFQAYSRARRLSGVVELRLGFDLDNTAADAGFESLSGFRDAFTKVFGEPAGQVDRAKAIHLGWVETPIGPMIADRATAPWFCSSSPTGG